LASFRSERDARLVADSAGLSFAGSARTSLLRELDFLFVENVGNLVCPSSYDLGENLRRVLMSVTEGEDKPLKYPTIFDSADVAVVTKNELADAVEFDWSAGGTSMQSVRPGMQIFRLSAKTGEGMEEYFNFLLSNWRSRERWRTPNHNHPRGRDLASSSLRQNLPCEIS
jgi:hydrogenase accessory protein HypB